MVRNRMKTYDAFAVSGALTALSTAKEVSKALDGVLKGLGLGQISKGIHHQKLATGIAALRSFGYSDEQIKRSPLRQVVDVMGEYPQAISKTADNGPKYTQEIMRKAGIDFNTLPPDGNPTPYNRPSGPSKHWMNVLFDIYGPGFYEFGHKIQRSELANVFPPLPPAQSTADSQAKAIAASAQEVKDTGVRQTTSADISTDNIALLKPLRGIMRGALLAAGYTPPDQLEELAMQFYDYIVVPATQSTYDANYLDDSVIDSIITFIATIQNKYEQGEDLPELYKKMGKQTSEVERKLEEDNDKSSMIMDNIGWIVGGIAFIIILILIIKQ